MYWLSLDLSSPLATIAIHRASPRPQLLQELALGDQYQHTERLLPKLQELLASTGLQLSDIKRYLTVCGPGSFTGLRIAMASLKAFAMVTLNPVDAISGSEARALAWAEEKKPASGTEVYVLTFVSSGRFVVSRFQTVEESVKLLSENVQTKLEVAGSTPVLDDGRVPADLVKGGAPQTFPLRARYLAETLSRAHSRKTFATLGEWIAMSPAYFGAQHYE